MTAPIRLTLPGEPVTADVTWDDVRRYLVTEGWALQGSDGDGGALWCHPGTVETVVRYPPQPGDPRARDLETGNVALAILTLARLADVAPGVMLARIAAPTPQLADLDGMADQFRATTRALEATLSHADQIYTDVARRQKAQHEATGGVPALPLGEYEQGFVRQGEKDMRERAAAKAERDGFGAIAIAIRALPLGGDR